MLKIVSPLHLRTFASKNGHLRANCIKSATNSNWITRLAFEYRFLCNLMPDSNYILTGLLASESVLQHRRSVLQWRAGTVLVHARPNHGTCTWCHDQATQSCRTLRTASIVLRIAVDSPQRSHLHIRYKTFL